MALIKKKLLYLLFLIASIAVLMLPFLPAIGWILLFPHGLAMIIEGWFWPGGKHSDPYLVAKIWVLYVALISCYLATPSVRVSIWIFAALAGLLILNVIGCYQYPPISGRPA